MADTSAYLIDTNILLRMVRRDDPDHRAVDAALAGLLTQERTLYYTHQNIAEFWNVATRPVKHNGFGLSVSTADAEVQEIEAGMFLLPDSEAVYREWRRLIVSHSVSGAKVHDARLVAAMRVHGITHLFTLNTSDFVRYPDITAVHPQSLAPEGKR